MNVTKTVLVKFYYNSSFLLHILQKIIILALMVQCIPQKNATKISLDTIVYYNSHFLLRCKKSSIAWHNEFESLSLD